MPNGDRDTIVKICLLQAYIDAVKDITDQLDGYVSCPLSDLLTKAQSLAMEIEQGIRKACEDI